MGIILWIILIFLFILIVYIIIKARNNYQEASSSGNVGSGAVNFLKACCKRTRT
jgi:uncharacterized membrane protein